MIFFKMIVWMAMNMKISYKKFKIAIIKRNFGFLDFSLMHIVVLDAQFLAYVISTIICMRGKIEKFT